MAGDSWPYHCVDELKASADGAIAIGPFGSRMKSDLYVANGVPVIRGNNISTSRALVGDFVYVTSKTADELRSSNVFPGDLFFPHRGAIGEVGIVPGDGSERYVLSTSLMKLTCNRELVDPLFLFYFFRSPAGRHELLKNSSTVGTPGIGQPLSSLRSILVPVPSMQEQRAIVHILGTLDDKIELNRRMNETLEAMAQALFKSWFVDFDPVRAKAEARHPGLPKHLADLFRDRLENSELGEIPAGWEVLSIYDVAHVIYGAPFASSQFNDQGDGSPLIRIRDLASETPGGWTPEVHPRGYKVRPGNIVVGMDGEFRAYLWGGVEAWLNQRVCVFAPKPGYSPAFVRSSIIEPLAHVEATETGTTVIHLGKSDIDQFVVVSPSAAILATFNDLCQPWYDRIVVGKQESITLAALRDALLPKLVSGELPVKDAERFLAEARA
jgi:type I restriction enzyme, S subunit